MKVNDVLVKDDVMYRVLAAQEGRFLCIDCCITRMPIWLSSEELAGFTEGSLPAVDKEISAVGMETAHKRFSLIAPYWHSLWMTLVEIRL